MKKFKKYCIYPSVADLHSGPSFPNGNFYAYAYYATLDTSSHQPPSSEKNGRNLNFNFNEIEIITYLLFETEI